MKNLNIGEIDMSSSMNIHEVTKVTIKRNILEADGNRECIDISFYKEDGEHLEITAFSRDDEKAIIDIGS